jgi:hypothetical protein
MDLPALGQTSTSLHIFPKAKTFIFEITRLFYAHPPVQQRMYPEALRASLLLVGGGE